MVKRIIWTSNADNIFKRILEYHIDRNKSNIYSRKLNKEIHSLLKILLKQPFLGLKTDNEKIRVFIHKNLKIFYQVSDDELIIHFIWDSRQTPDNLNFKMKF